MINVRDSRVLMVSMLFLSHMIIPCVALGIITFIHVTPLVWALWIFVTSLCILLLYITGYWGTFYRRVRTVLIILFVAAIAFKLSSMNFGNFQFDRQWGTIISLAIGLPVSLFFIMQIFNAISARKYPVTAVNISFPFKQGNFSISDGGNGQISPLMNYHFKFSGHSKKRTNKAMAYAVDIVQLSAWGAAAWNLFPNQNEKYPIYGKEIVSPCDGIVVSVENTIVDNRPFGPRPYNIGNYVAIKSDGFQVLLGHLKQSSIRVKTGDSVKKGQALALAGNSGWTERPHLHMQAMKINETELWKNEGLPILFDGKNPIKNARFLIN